MSNSITKFSNNIFDLNIFTKKEFVEMIDNLIKTAKLKGYTSTENFSNDLIDKELKKFGIVTESQNIDIIKAIIGFEKYRELALVLNGLGRKGYSQDEDICKYSFKMRYEHSEKYENQNYPNIVDLFCGAGGLSLGFVQNGFKIIFANDIERAALRTYSFNHPEVSGERITMGGIEDISFDIRKYVKEDVDVLLGGPPCQGFSTANRQRIIDDPRNVLYKYYVESVKNLNPKFFVMENVKGMEAVAEQVKEDFNSNTEIPYNISYDIFNAKKFGIPQNRERLIYIGIRKDIEEEYKINALDIIEEVNGQYYTNNVPLSDALMGLRPLKALRKKNATELDSDISGNKIDIFSNEETNNYIRNINLQKDIELFFNHKARYNNDRDIEIYRRMLPGDKSNSERIADIMPYKSRNHMFLDKYYKLVPNLPCKTITAHMRFDCNMYIHPNQARGLTPRESARVQSYPDDYFFLGPYTKTYMQIGNSVPPVFSKILSNVIKKYLKGK